MPKKYKGVFIVLEGPDKSGKSTQAQTLGKYFHSLGREVVWTREPGGTPFAEAIRALLLNPLHTVSPIAELLLYEASRAQHVQEKILPALKAGKIVLCERFTMSSLAYQGYGRGFSISVIEKLNRIATQGLEPDLTVIFDIPEKYFVERCRKKAADRLELEPAQFRERVRRGYRELGKKHSGAVLLVDGKKPLAAVQSRIRREIDRLLRKDCL